MVYTNSSPLIASTEGLKFDSARLKSQLTLDVLRDQFAEAHLAIPSEEPCSDFVERLAAVVTLQSQLEGAVGTSAHECHRQIVGGYVVSCRREAERLIRSLYAEDAQDLLVDNFEVMKQYLLLCLEAELGITESNGTIVQSFGDLERQLSTLRYLDLCDLCKEDSQIRDEAFRKILFSCAQQSIELEVAALSTEFPTGISPKDIIYDSYEDILINAALQFYRASGHSPEQALMSTAQAFSLPYFNIKEVADVLFLKIALYSCISDATARGVFEYALTKATRGLEEMSVHQLLQEAFASHYVFMSMLGKLNGEEYPVKKVAEDLAERLVDSVEIAIGEDEELIAGLLEDRKGTEFALSLWMTLAYSSNGSDQAPNHWQRAGQVIDQLTHDQQILMKEELLSLIVSDRESALRAEAEKEGFVMKQLQDMAANGAELARLLRSAHEHQEHPLSNRALALCSKLELVSADITRRIGELG